MRPGIRLSIGCVAAVLFVWACVGNDPGTTNEAEPGNEGGQCFANGTCNTGLACVDDKCAISDGGTTSGDATSAPDSGTKSDGGASDDAGNPGCHVGTIHGPGSVFCPGDPNHACSTPAQQCCNEGCNDVSNGCQDNLLPWQCQSVGDCTTGICCMHLENPANTSACPAVGTVHTSRCQADCDAGDYRLCENGGDCDSGICDSFHAIFQVNPPDSGLILGVCAP